MHVLDFTNIWRDYYDSILGEFNDFLFKYTNKKEGYSILQFQTAQENYLLGIYFDFLAKLNEKDSSLIDQEEIRDLLSYDFARIDEEELNTDKYVEFSEFYLYRPINSFIEDKYNLFKRDCSYLLMNKKGYCDSVKYLLCNNDDLANAYTDYLFDDIDKQKSIYKRTTKRLNDIANGDFVRDEDYQLFIENYKRLYLKKRVYEDIISQRRKPDVDVSLLGNNFNYLNNLFNGNDSTYKMDEKSIATKIFDDYLELCDKLDNEYKMVSNKKNKVLKK